jgi:hypothetical protein
MNDEPEETCWICNEQSDVFHAADDLLHPCACTGSVGTVHRECLTKWVRNSGKTHCMQCLSEYVLAPAEQNSWNGRVMAVNCTALFLAESALFLALAHVPIALVAPIAYASWTSAADNVQTRIAGALLTAYGGELVVLLCVSVLCCCFFSISAHTRSCECSHCRCGDRSLITDLYLFSLLSSNRNAGGSGGDCNCSSGGGGGGSSGSSGSGSGFESVGGIPIAIAVLAVLSVFLFYAFCLSVILYIAYRHVSKYYAGCKMDAFVIQSIR